MNKTWRHSALALTATWAALAACSDDGLVRRSPILQVTPVESPHYTVDAQNLTIDLGEVPLYSTATAVFKLDNPSEMPLTIKSVTVVTSQGERWLDPEYTSRVERFGHGELRVGYSPINEGTADMIKLLISSDAAQNPNVEVTVMGTGVFVGAPDIDVEYTTSGGSGLETAFGPQPSDCVDVDSDGTIDGCAIPATRPIFLGNVALSGQGSARIKLHNRAACAPYPGIDPCSTCELILDKGARNVGFGFKEGTNDQGLFAFEGSTATPLPVQQANVNDCGSSGVVGPIQINFNAPATEGDFSTVLVIESNDPDEPVIEIPIIALARNAPVAINKFRPFDPANPTEYTDPSDIEPLTRVYFDGSDSYDPADPNDSSLIAGYYWEIIEFPAGTNPSDFQIQGQNSPYFSFWLPLAGHYVVRLTVTNTSGVQSGDTADARKEFDVVPGSRLHVQLTWDNSSNDQDLHLTNYGALPASCASTGCICDMDYDCHWQNCNPGDAEMPAWFGGQAGNGPNPSLDIDDTNGLGPENINIDSPQPGTYRVNVHHWSSSTDGGGGSTRNTIRIYLDGIQAAEYRRSISGEQLWEVADIVWTASGGTVQPITADAAGQVGRVTSLTRSACTGSMW